VVSKRSTTECTFLQKRLFIYEVHMKKLFFALGFVALTACGACGPAEVETKLKTDTGVIDQAPAPPLEPVGVIPADDCQHVDIGDKACNFRLTDQNGKVWDLYSHKGDVIMLDFSAVWCYPCQAAADHTQTLQDDYAGDGVQIVTILIDGPTPGQDPSEYDIAQWAALHNITSAPVLQGSRDKMLDPQDSEIEPGTAGYLLSAWPTYIYIGRDMRFYAGHVGFSEEYARQKIEEGL
jgi:thiol-disulfide isomerase/thioredoxin